MPDPRSRRLAALAAALTLGVLTFTLWRATRVPRWRADVRYLAAELPRRHANAYRYVTPGAFAREAAAVDSAVPHLTDAQVGWRLSALAALVQDGHTYASRPGYPALLPLEVLWTDTGPWVVGADAAHAALAGHRITAVDGRPVAAVADTLARYLPHENRWGLWAAAARALVVPGALRDLGVADRADALTLDLAAPAPAPAKAPGAAPAAGAARVTVLAVAARDVWWAPFIPAPPPGGEPLYRQRRGERFWLAVLPAERLVFVKYNECRDSADFAQISDSVARLVDAGQVTRVLVDLRDNQGGNSQVTRPLIEAVKARPAVNRPGGLYVAIGRATFSSGLMAADDFRKETRAVLVGEPIGERVNNYGEVAHFRLPWSRTYVQYSTKAFRFAEQDTDAYAPDVLVPPTPEAVTAGRDPVLDWVRAQPPVQPRDGAQAAAGRAAAQRGVADELSDVKPL